MLSLSGDQQSTGALAGIQAALDYINSRDDLLPGYSLHYTLNDSECNRTAALDGLFTQLFQPPQGKVALIGSGCSTATEATAEISHYYNINQISCTASITEFNYKMNYFQLLPSEANLALAFHGIIKEYKWRRVALVVQNEPRFKTTMYSLINMLSNTKLHYSQLSIESILQQKIFDSEFRVYILFTSSRTAKQLLCKAHTLGLKYPKYLFMTYGSYEPRWWTMQYNDTDNDCSAQDVAEILQFSLAVSHFRIPSRDNLFYHVCYDAMFTLAYALQNVTQDMDFEKMLWNANNTMQEFESDELTAKCYTNNLNLHTLLNHHLRSTNFTGKSGPVHFNLNGIRDAVELQMLQYRMNESHVFGEGDISQQLRLVPVAHFRQDTGILEFDRVDILWPEGVPYDGVPSEEYVTIALPVTVIFIILNIFGIICAVICCLFNAIFHKKRLIRLDSPNLNYLIIFGSLGAYMSCILFVIPTLVPSAVVTLCILRLFPAIIGYTLTFGSVTAKLWRINKIFRSPKTAKKKQGIKDHHLVLFVLSLTSIDIVILVAYIVVESLLTGFEVGTESNEENPRAFHGELEIETVYFRYTCSTNSWIRTIAISLVYLYKFVEYICAFYYAFRLRKVKMKSLNDTKYIVAFVYITSIILATTCISTLTLSKYINVYAAVYNLGFWLATSAILGLLFVPKMVRLYKDPEGNSALATKEKSVTLEIPTSHQETQNGTDDIDTLKQRVKQLELELTKQSV